MNSIANRIGPFGTVCMALAITVSASGQANTPATPHDRARVALSQPLPGLSGDRLKATLVEVHYGPGESSPPHSHPCAVVGYVIQGKVRSQVKGEPEKTYKTGDSFYEPANAVHLVSANASFSDPAAFVAFFLCDQDGPLSVNLDQHLQTKGESK